MPIVKHVVDNITYYDINRVKNYDINDEIKITNDRFSNEIDEVIRDIVSNIE